MKQQRMSEKGSTSGKIASHYTVLKFFSLFGRLFHDYRLKQKLCKYDMTIETITEQMFHGLNISNNSSDGNGIKHVQERPYKGKWTE